MVIYKKEKQTVTALDQEDGRVTIECDNDRFYPQNEMISLQTLTVNVRMMLTSLPPLHLAGNDEILLPLHKTSYFSEISLCDANYETFDISALREINLNHFFFGELHSLQYEIPPG